MNCKELKINWKKSHWNGKKYKGIAKELEIYHKEIEWDAFCSDR